MSGSWRQGYVKCPFYIRDDGLRITCEGHYAGARTSYTFDEREDFEAHFRERCCSVDGCRQCAMYKSIQRYKYLDKKEGQGP